MPFAGINSIAPRLAQGLGMFSPLIHLEYERERDERGVRIRCTRLRAERASQSGRRAVRFWRDRKSGANVSFFHVTNRISYSGFAKTFETQKTGIALAAGETFRRGIVTAVSERKVDAKLDSFTNNFGFRKLD